MTISTEAQEADRALKSKHRALWALGDYASVAAEVIAPTGPTLVKACGITAGQRVLDVAAGSGNAAIPAALTGAEVVASDLTPELLEAGQLLAEQVGAQLKWEQADAEALPYGDNDFDVVMSCVGVMFAPHHQTTADELVRVCRPGGTIGLINWTPEGFIGQMFATMKPYAAPPPPGASPPPLWGSATHLEGLFGDRVTGVSFAKQTVHIGRFESGEAFRDYFKENYGPTIATYRNIASDPAKVAALDNALAELGRKYDLGNGAMEWEYLLFTARKAS